MKILAVCGSPRKGNCFSALNSIKENYPTVDFKIMMLNNMKFKQCRGCYVCVLKGEDKCPIKDDRDMIINEMLDADGVIWASPVYAVQVSSIMKNFIDRLGYYAHRPAFDDKYAMAMVTCSGYGADDTNKYMGKILSAFGFNVVSPLELQTPPGLTSEKMKKANHENTMKAFDELINRIEKGGRDTPSIGLVVVFNLFKSVSEKYPEMFKADYEYYKDKATFFYDTKINPLKKMVANKVVKKIMKE